MNSIRRPLLILTTLGLLLPTARLPAMTDAEAASGRALVKKYADSIVSVELVVTVKVTVTGLAAVGLTEFDGKNAQAAPAGRPLGQLRTTVDENEPAAVTWNVLTFEAPPCGALRLPGLGAEILKSTMWRVRAAS